MATSIISVENLSKSYLVGHRGETAGSSNYMALRDVIGREIRNTARKAVDVLRGRQVVDGDTVEQFWALRDVSFEVRQGEVLGIIGHNGAGKSTLLKVLSRITQPTLGRITLHGRVASLLEVGTGFHPELTGRENIFLNGAILGMSRTEIRKKFDEIVAFAEVERFLDTPVKRYSSGMYVRLAFAVAAHLEPEILVVDEVLAVGDAEFQRKCLGKMDEVSHRDGRTVLVVSHNLGLITSLCGRALWLDHGSLHEKGESQYVVGRYLATASGEQRRLILVDQVERPPYVQDDRLRCTAVEWLSPLPLRNGEPAVLRLQLTANTALAEVSAVVGFCSLEGQRILTYQNNARRDIDAPGDFSIELQIDPVVLGPDQYSLDIGFRSGPVHVLDLIRDVARVEVIIGPNTPSDVSYAGYRNSSGVRLEGCWSWQAQPEKIDLVSTR